MIYEYYLKSHTTVPDFEGEITEKELKEEGCPIRRADDPDDTRGYRCGNKEFTIVNVRPQTLTCQTCGAVFEETLASLRERLLIIKKEKKNG